MRVNELEVERYRKGRRQKARKSKDEYKCLLLAG
jgi:hypothetical protein